MILDTKETTVAYRCPHCGQTTVSVVGVFALTGDLIRLKCGCKKSELQISYTSDRKIRITTPCLVCQKPHTFVLGAGTFFADRVLTYSCPMTGLELCFIGKKDEVLAAASEADRHLLELMDEAGLENLDEIKSPESEDDREDIYFITDVVRFLISELQEDHAIHCRCANPDDQDIQFRFTTDEDGNQIVHIFCKTCGAGVGFPIVSAGEANRFLTTDELNLQ